MRRFGLGTLTLALLALLGAAPAQADPFACQVEGEYRGSAGSGGGLTSSALVTFVFQPPADCDEGVPGTLQVTALSRIAGKLAPSAFVGLGFYTIDSKDVIQIVLGGGAAIEGKLTFFGCEEFANAIMFQGGPGTAAAPGDPVFVVAGSAIRTVPAFCWK